MTATAEVLDQDRGEGELERSVSVLRATLEATADGLLVVSNDGHIECFNRRFGQLWNVPPAIMASHDGPALLRHTRALLPEGQGLVTAPGLAENPNGSSFDVLELRDGRVIERYSHPRTVAGRAVGRVWSFRDLTARCRTEQALVRSQDRLRALAARLEAIREEERTSVAREIHDELGQALTGLRFDLSAAAAAEPATSPLPGRQHALVGQVDGILDAVRRIASDLRPGVLDELGLAAAAEWLAQQFERRFGIRCRVHARGDDAALGRDRATAVFRIAQEALTNVARHAGARTVDIRLDVSRTAVTLRVRDDGRGVSAAELDDSRGLGLLGMRERALLWRGRLQVRALRGGGTLVSLRLPLPTLPAGTA